MNIAVQPMSDFWARPPWTVLPRRELDHLQAYTRAKTYARHQSVYRQAEKPLGLYCVMTGDVLLERISADGMCTAFRIAKAGDVFGFRALFARQHHAATARSLTKSQIALVPAAQLRDALASNSEFALEMLRVVAADPGPMNAPLLRTPLIPAARRLAHLLLVLQGQYAHRAVGPGVRFRLPVTRGCVAALIAIRPETVSRLFQQLSTMGICMAQKSEIIIPDVARLAEFAAQSDAA